MKISGFTFVRNATKLFIPAKEAIASILPIVDEFVVALSEGDEDDTTEEEILSLKSDKIKIVRTEWESEKFPKNTLFARQTDIAKEACTGDWLFYLQCDEAVHEQYLPIIKEAFDKYYSDAEVEGFVFHYKHFWGDFEHYNPSHAFYKREVRVIRNVPQIHSFKDAQSFRFHLCDFNYTFEDYQRKENTRKLNVAQIKAEIYHYGWVRPPELMGRKRKISSTSYRGADETAKRFKDVEDHFDYGPMNRVKKFSGTHPASMQQWTKKIYWKDQLQYSGKPKPKTVKPKNERLKYRMLTWVEVNLLMGKQIGEFKNFKRIR